MNFSVKFHLRLGHCIPPLCSALTTPRLGYSHLTATSCQTLHMCWPWPCFGVAESVVGYMPIRHATLSNGVVAIVQIKQEWIFFYHLFSINCCCHMQNGSFMMLLNSHKGISNVSRIFYYKLAIASECSLLTP